MSSTHGYEKLVEWFQRHPSFYYFGLVYLHSDERVEELMLQSIVRIDKKKAIILEESSSFIRIFSVFFAVCCELQGKKGIRDSERLETDSPILKGISMLEDRVKDVMALTAIMGMSQEDCMDFLHITKEEFLEQHSSGILQLREILGKSPEHSGCTDYATDYLCYLERSMERTQKIEFETHLYHCEKCQDDLASFQEIYLALKKLKPNLTPIPVGINQNLNQQLNDRTMILKSKQKKRNRISLVSSVMFVVLLSIGYFTGAISNVYYHLSEENPELRHYLQNNLGEPLNLVAENNGIRITIKSVVADELQTLVYYTIEDLQHEQLYMLDYHDGLTMENALLNLDYNSGYEIPNLESKVNKGKRNIYEGKMGMPPLVRDDEVIHLQIHYVQKLVQNHTEQYVEEDTRKHGKWTFEIPVKKQPVKEYAIDQAIEIDGVPVRFEKIIIAPTATVLHYAAYNVHSKKVDYLSTAGLQVNEHRYKENGGAVHFSGFYGETEWSVFQLVFQPIFEKNPKELVLHLNSAHLSIDDYKTVPIVATVDKPQVIPYGNGSITIEQLEVGNPTVLTLSYGEPSVNRFEHINYRLRDENGEEISSISTEGTGETVDSNLRTVQDEHVEYSMEELNSMRYFMKEEKLELYNDFTDKHVIPHTLVLEGYTRTVYNNKKIKIPLKSN